VTGTPHGSRHRRSEQAVSTLTTMISALIMLMSILTTTHILVSLQQRSVVTAIVMDVVSDNSRSGGLDERATERYLRRRLGEQTVIEWSEDGSQLVLRVVARPRSLFLRGPLASFGRIDVRVSSRKEDFVGDA
jgi:hypothetical protein